MLFYFVSYCLVVNAVEWSICINKSTRNDTCNEMVKVAVADPGFQKGGGGGAAIFFICFLTRKGEGNKTLLGLILTL